MDVGDRQPGITPDQPPPSMLEAALGYAKLGWRVFPLHAVRGDGSCSCKRMDCGNPGKHPSAAGGMDGATTDADQIRYWWGTWWPEANIGIATGKESGIVVVDVSTDVRTLLAWEKLCQTYTVDDDDGGYFGRRTRTITTGSGAQHIYFKHPGGERPSVSSKLCHGVNLIGDGGYVVAPPSRHASGKRFTAWFKTAVADMPDWMLAILDGRPAPKPPAPPEPVPAPPSAMSAVPKPEKSTRERPPPHTDDDLAPVVNLQTREQMSIQAQIEAAKAQTIPKQKRMRPLRNRSPLALYQILGDPSGLALIFGTTCAHSERHGDVCAECTKRNRIRMNELTTNIHVGAEPLTASGPQKIRIEIEREFLGDDKGGGLAFSLQEVETTLRLIAEENSYNPVREYLQRLKWDGNVRIPFMLDEILHTERSAANIMMLKRWMISAVARAFRPGCKADLMLVLVGETQGEKKGTFFEVLASSEWYTCTPIDVHNKDAAAMMHSAWIMEWAELTTLMRSGDIESVKSFLTTAVDKYRPPYGRVPQPYPRTCVVGGTTNKPEFLNDETGARRFLPITVTGKINIELLKEWRDQLWAEAVALHNAGEQWWLSDDEEKLLPSAQGAYTVEDSWEAPISGWILNQAASSYTTSDVLRGALEKPIGQWTRQDEMRVSKVLKGLGYSKNNNERPRKWRKVAVDEAEATTEADNGGPTF